MIQKMHVLSTSGKECFCMRTDGSSSSYISAVALVLAEGAVAVLLVALHSSELNC